MRDLMSTTKLVAILAITVALVVIGILNLRDRLSLPPVADDKVEWVDTADGVQAKSVSPDSPLAYNVRKGDYVKAFFHVGKYDDASRPKPASGYLDYEEVTRAETLSRYLANQGVGNKARYAILHRDPVLKGLFGIDQDIYDVDFKVVARDQHLGRGLYLAFIGLVYLAIGLFVLFKQRRAALTHHFYVWSLVSFVVYFYSSTAEFTSIDKFVSLLDRSALAVMAPLFLHFCENFPSNRGLLARKHTLAVARITLEQLLHLQRQAIKSLALMWSST